MLLMSYLERTSSEVKAIKRVYVDKAAGMKHVKLNVLQLLQLRLHPQPVCLVLELSSVMEHHAAFGSACSLLSDPCVNKG